VNSITRMTCHVERTLDSVELHRCGACGGMYWGEGSYILHACVAGSSPSPLPGPVPVRLAEAWARMADQGRAVAFDLARRHGLAGGEIPVGAVMVMGHDGRLVPATSGQTLIGTVVSASGRTGTIRLGGMRRMDL
jgi:hypothetical protein